MSQKLPTALTVNKEGALVSYRSSGVVDLKDKDKLCKLNDVKGLLSNRLEKVEEYLEEVNPNQDKHSNKEYQKLIGRRRELVEMLDEVDDQ